MFLYEVDQFVNCIKFISIFHKNLTQIIILSKGAFYNIMIEKKLSYNFKLDILVTSEGLQ